MAYRRPIDQNGCQQDKEKGKPPEKWQIETVHKENIKPGSSFDGILDYKFLNQSGDHTTDKKSEYGSPGSRGISLIIIYHYDSRNRKQIQQMDTYGEPHHIKYENDPAVSFRFFSFIFPFQNGPKYQGGKKG